jgi:UDP-hydrolysing UDP-N-acetyl-D-glucosamine 2-epimerase
MRKIAVFTGTRAEYGLLYWLMKDIENDPELELKLIVSGTHLSPEFGNTYKQIESDGFNIDDKVEMLLSSDTQQGVAKSMGLGVIGFADSLTRLAPDILIILGDRFEALAIAQVATIFKLPIFHFHGGEITQGAYDDSIRHAITKLSTYHFTCTEPYRKRVIQLGESPDKVFNYGAIGLEHIRRTKLLSKVEFYRHLDLNLDKPFFLLTYHPATLADEDAESTIKNIFEALSSFPNYQVVITYPNADDGGRKIITLIDEYTSVSNNAKAYKSLGQLKYFSALKYCSAVLGNSSSGISEVPYFKKPTVNIGDRQKGRLAPASVINCGSDAYEIKNAIADSLDESFLKSFQKALPMFGDGNTSEKVINKLKNCDLNVSKKFYDIYAKEGKIDE